MKSSFLFLSLFAIGLCSCTESPSEPLQAAKYVDRPYHKHSGISIQNGPRQGFQYYDSLKTEYNYRYITSTVSNDSGVPLRLKIAFANEYQNLHTNKSLISKVFLLPRKLTPAQQQFDESMSKELKQFLDKEVDIPVTIDTTLLPNQRLVMTFAVLNARQYGEYMRMELISSHNPFHLNAHDSLKKPEAEAKQPFSYSLGLHLVNAFVIPCGQITFIKD